MSKQILDKLFPKGSLKDGNIIGDELILFSFVNNSRGTITTVSRREHSQAYLPLEIRVYSLERQPSPSEDVPYRIQSILYSINLEDNLSTHYDKALRKNGL